jgi:hypothetical protein
MALVDYQKSYYQKNKEWIRRNQTEYFKEYYEKNRLELKERNRIRNNANYRKIKSTKEEMLPTIEEFELLEKSLKTSEIHSPKTKPRKPKKKTKVREPPPRFSFAKGEFTLTFD